MRSLTDLELLEKVLAKSESAWTELICRYKPLMIRVISGCLVGRYEDIDDVFSDACLKLVDKDMYKLRAFAPERGYKLGTWLGLIARNAAFDYIRRVKNRPCGTDDIPELVSDEPGPLDELLNEERRLLLHAALRNLPPKDQRFAALYREDICLNDIAAQLGVARRTVDAKSFKLRESLSFTRPRFAVADRLH